MTARKSKPGWQSGDPRNDKIYVAILSVLMATVVIGAVVTIVGELVLQNEAMKTTGFSVALIAGGIYFAFRVFGRVRSMQWQARRRESDRRDGEGGEG